MTGAPRRRALGPLLAAMLAAAAPAAAQEDPPDFLAGLAAYDGGRYGEAARIWGALAETGHADALVSLAALHLEGLGVARDAARAAALFRRAALGGHPVAQMNLGEMLAQGRGVARDPVEGWAWLALAAAQGRDWAARERDRVAAALTPAQRARAAARLDALRERIRGRP